jgi:DNA-binding PadR family transcriptional regulator
MNHLQSLYPKAANRAEVEGQLTGQGIRNSPNASEELESLEDAGKIESREISTPDGDVRYYRATEAGTVEGEGP